MRNTFYIPDNTWSKLDHIGIYQDFMKEYLALLQTQLKKYEVQGDDSSYTYYTCGQQHDSRNPFWQPFKYLNQICKKYDYDSLIAKDIIEERIGRNLTCECELLGKQSGGGTF